MRPILLFILVLLTCPVSMLGQDIHFSQAGTTPLIYNPALTGNFYGSWRFAHSFRSQWNAIGQPYNTLSLSFDKSINVGRKKIYAGIALLDDKSGVIGLHKSGLMLSGAYQFLMRNSILRLGVQAGIFNLGYNLNGATVPGQYDHSIGGFNPDLPYNEPNLGESKLYPDLNLGALYKVLLGKYNTEIGVAVFHVNQPNYSFYGADSIKLDMTYKTHFTIKFPVGEKLNIQPAAYFISMAHANNLLIGSDVLLDVPPNKNRLHALYAGAYLRTGFDRNTDAIIAVLGAKLFQFNIGISYDLNISQLQKAPQIQGAFELSLTYTGMGKQINPATIPCFRQ
ncbi:MAG: PorP/SprF family type IX secretion system membrane protein [Bacteroidales bacterium]|nr:PorP/SprF family type IX secretion system membrane protein [Bacteroidales bacterium]MCF8456761.1 PorP/SprF family type IX secretion system membrane protein [Bacteroidales bacterium]